MAKPDSIHKDYKIRKMTFTNGDVVEIRTTYRNDIILDNDPFTHPAWNPDKVTVASKSDATESYKNRFGDLFADV